MKKTVFFLVLTLILIPIAAHAGGPSVLIGLQSVSFAGDLGEYYDIAPSPGIGVLVGFDTAIPFDLRVGVKTGTEGNSNDDLTYVWIELGSKLNLGVEGTSMQPDLFFGVGSYSLEIGDLEFDSAIGGYLGMGVEEIMGGKYIGRIEAKAVYWKSDTLQTDAPSLNVALMFGYQF